MDNQNFSSQNQGTFSNFRKRAGQTSPLPLQLHACSNKKHIFILLNIHHFRWLLLVSNIENVLTPIMRVIKLSNKFHTSCFVIQSADLLVIFVKLYRVDYSFNKVKPFVVSRYLLKVVQYIKKLILVVKVVLTLVGIPHKPPQQRSSIFLDSGKDVYWSLHFQATRDVRCFL